MLHQTKGIVLKSVKFSETSVIVKIYTEKLGMQNYIVNGVRSAKSKDKSTLLQPLTILNLVVYYRENKNLQRIKEMSFHHLYNTLPFEIQKSSIGLFLLEVLLKSIKEEEANPELFQFITSELISLDRQTGSVANFHLGFLLKLSRYLGFSPDNNYSNDLQVFDLREGYFIQNPPGHADFLTKKSALLMHHLLNGSGFSCTSKERKGLLGNMLHYYSLHIPEFSSINSTRILEEILK